MAVLTLANCERIFVTTAATIETTDRLKVSAINPAGSATGILLNKNTMTIADPNISMIDFKVPSLTVVFFINLVIAIKEPRTRLIDAAPDNILDQLALPNTAKLIVKAVSILII